MEIVCDDLPEWYLRCQPGLHDPGSTAGIDEPGSGDGEGEDKRLISGLRGFQTACCVRTCRPISCRRSISSIGIGMTFPKDFAMK